jgi:hypothetical protein
MKLTDEHLKILDEIAHYEKERLEAERKPAPADSVAGVRDAMGLAGRRGDFNWLKGCN